MLSLDGMMGEGLFENGISELELNDDVKQWELILSGGGGEQPSKGPEVEVCLEGVLGVLYPQEARGSLVGYGLRLERGQGPLATVHMLSVWNTGLRET